MSEQKPTEPTDQDTEDRKHNKGKWAKPKGKPPQDNGSPTRPIPEAVRIGRRMIDPTMFGSYSGERERRCELYTQLRDEEGFTHQDIIAELGNRISLRKLSEYQSVYDAQRYRIQKSVSNETKTKGDEGSVKK